jgi:hypothetical protein
MRHCSETEDTEVDTGAPETRFDSNSWRRAEAVRGMIIFSSVLVVDYCREGQWGGILLPGRDIMPLGPLGGGGATAFRDTTTRVGAALILGVLAVSFRSSTERATTVVNSPMQTKRCKWEQSKRNGKVKRHSSSSQPAARAGTIPTPGPLRLSGIHFAPRPSHRQSRSRSHVEGSESVSARLGHGGKHARWHPGSAD